MNYTPDKPFIQTINYRNGRSVVYEPMELFPEGTDPFEPVFRLPNGVQPTPQALSELWLPDRLIKKIVTASNAYARKLLPRNQVVAVTEEEILRFLAVYYYMGVVRLPSKEDYFRQEPDFWPVHAAIANLSYKRFKYIWRTIHLTQTDEGVDVEEPDLPPDSDEQPEEDNEEEPVDDADADIEREVDTRWYAKVGMLVDHFIEVAQRVCTQLGFCLSIDEMMKLFKGRSAQTARMKNKPIKEGFKFFSLCDCQTGYIWNIIPDGRLVKTTIYDVVMELVRSIPKKESVRYVVGMDNYFTYPKILKSMREEGVGCVGTARAKQGWPPKEFKDVSDDRFNSLYLLNDEKNFLIGRWVDNNVVTMVSTVHTGHETVRRQRRRPRVTATNRNNIQQVWGNAGVKEIEIPGIIDDYNHWMGGVDKADQLISYYRPDLRCRRVWMPLMFHVLDCIRVNAFVIHKSKYPQQTHKMFLKEWIKALSARATAASLSTRRGARHSSPTVHTPPTKRRRMSHKRPNLPDYRFNGMPEEHFSVTDEGLVGPKPTPRSCVYCSYEAAIAKIMETEPPMIKKTIKKCNYCQDYLCKHHFNAFHQRDDHGNNNNNSFLPV